MLTEILVYPLQRVLEPLTGNIDWRLGKDFASPLNTYNSITSEAMQFQVYGGDGGYQFLARNNPSWNPVQRLLMEIMQIQVMFTFSIRDITMLVRLIKISQH